MNVGKENHIYRYNPWHTSPLATVTLEIANLSYGVDEPAIDIESWWYDYNDCGASNHRRKTTSVQHEPFFAATHHTSSCVSSALRSYTEQARSIKS